MGAQADGRGRSATKIAAALASATLLSGCVAAALPVIAAGGLVSTRAGDRDDPPPPRPRVALPADRDVEDGDVQLQTPATVREASYSDGSTVTVINTLSRTPTAAPQPAADVPTAPATIPPPTGATIRLTDLRALPPPAAATGPSGAGSASTGYAAFAEFASAQAALPAAGSIRKSAFLLDSASVAPVTRECSIHPAAVLIDLDPADELFDLAGAGSADEAFAARLAGLRSEGVTIGWVSSRTADRAGAVRKALQTSGLDPSGRDELVLLRFPEESKQTRRNDFARAYCVVAIAGDERADFDELFGYLRDPTAALPLESLVGQGWFLVPTPLQ